MFNLPEKPAEKTAETITAINKVITEVTGEDIRIEYGHRTGKQREVGPRAVIFRFISRQERWAVLGKRKEFFKEGYPIFEDLPEEDLAEKKKHSAAIKVLHDNGDKVTFFRGKWHVNRVEYNG